jgi:small-conductance mechanosensitive channel
LDDSLPTIIYFGALILLKPIFSFFAPPIFISSDEMLTLFEDRGIYIILIFAIVLITAYSFMFLSRAMKYLRMQESVYLDKSVLDSVEISVKSIWGLVVLFACLGLLGKAWDWFWVNVWFRLTVDPNMNTGYIAPLMFCVIVIVVVWLTIKFVHQMLQYQAGNLKNKPKKTINPRVALLVELMLKYFLISIGGILILTIGLTAIGYYNYIIGGLWDWLLRNKASLVFVIIVTILGIFFERVFETFFEDMKKKETPFSPQIMDIAKVVSKYLIILLVGITVLYSFLQMFDLRETGLIIVTVIIVFIGIIVVIAATSNLRNGFSGIIIMVFKPFVVGDRIRILDGIICDVVSVGIIFTRVRTLRGEVIDVPNNEIINKTILNYNRSEDYAISITVAFPLSADREMAKGTMVSAALAIKRVLQKKRPEIYTLGIEQERVVMEMLVFTDAFRRIKHTKSELVHNISKALSEKGIHCSVHISDHDDVERMRILRGHNTGPDSDQHGSNP